MREGQVLSDTVLGQQDPSATVLQGWWPVGLQAFGCLNKQVFVKCLTNSQGLSLKAGTLGGQMDVSLGCPVPPSPALACRTALSREFSRPERIGDHTQESLSPESASTEIQINRGSGTPWPPHLPAPLFPSSLEPGQRGPRWRHNPKSMCPAPALVRGPQRNHEDQGTLTVTFWGGGATHLHQVLRFPPQVLPAAGRGGPHGTLRYQAAVTLDARRSRA